MMDANVFVDEVTHASMDGGSAVLGRYRIGPAEDLMYVICHRGELLQPRRPLPGPTRAGLTTVPPPELPAAAPSSHSAPARLSRVLAG
jgi:hypothetical protein